jgi:hypothetical protein
VVTAVKDLQQTVVAEIKAATADGKISEAEKQRIKDAAVANVKSYLGTKGIRVLAEVLGLSGGALDTGAYISSYRTPSDRPGTSCPPPQRRRLDRR